jgi:hypothetical protein
MSIVVLNLMHRMLDGVILPLSHSEPEIALLSGLALLPSAPFSLCNYFLKESFRNLPTGA